jgi:hypothetical protein
MKKVAAITFMAVLASTPQARAQPVEAPVVKPGDTWTYRSTTEAAPAGWTQVREELSVTRVTSSTIFVTVKQSGSTQVPKETFAGRDWSRIRDVNGKETIVNRPLSFPLAIGQTWTLTYEEQQPNPAHKSERFDNKYVVLGYETVEVPAGKFRALKIESEGHWYAELAPGQVVTQGAQSNAQGSTIVSSMHKTGDRTSEGRTYKAFWYAPEVKRWVKVVEEYYSSDGVRNQRYMQELESFKTAE